MKFYSEQTKKLYETEEQLKEAENKYALEVAEKEKAVVVKKEKANKVEDAYKHIIEVRKESAKAIEAAEKEYYKLRDEFIKEYGSYHQTYTNIDGEESCSFSAEDFFDLLRELF